MRRRTLYNNNTYAGILSNEAVAGDICLYNKQQDRLELYSQNVFDDNTFPLSKYTPVGVVVIPGSHNVYGDGSCGVMSLKEMNYNTPDTGSTSYQGIYWGQYDTDISNLTNYNKVCYVGSNGTVNQTVQGVNINSFLPSDNFTTLQNPYDKDTYFYYKDNDYYAPSPYNEDDTRNPAYYQTASPSSSKNALSYFDGMGNTTKLIKLATGQSNWKTASTITNNSGSGYSPAACCCWRYHTEGTNQGDWYLPACGELGYMMVKFNKINQTISTLTSAYGSSVGIRVHYDYTYLSSSELNSTDARYVNTYNGNVSYDYKNSIGSYVRAFLRVGA